MSRGEARLGALSVAWDVPDALPGATGGLEHLPATTRSDDVATFPWIVDRGPVGIAPERYAAFYGPVRLVFEPFDAVRVWSPSADLRVTPKGLRGRAEGPCALAASIALHVVAAHGGLAHAHAAVVCLDGATLLMPGGSGSGKTSAALAVARGGGVLVCDDAAYVDVDRVVWPVRRPPHVSDTTLAAHPDLDVLGAVFDGSVSKFRARLPDPRDAPPARIDAVVLPTIDRGARTSIEPVEAAAVFATLLGSSALAVVPGAPHRDAMIDILADLAAVPAARLVAGPDALLDPLVIARALRAWLATRPR
ncbi:hypothetical protein [Sandaracinus amylolyticus]|uniref:HPr kinase n=1 Tax=Sandaracinus amylolyticus TaxID=927083 RepID=A0A0F6W472_9BACT|nr:hypothetical protein [Sandaracinus amylolyticus]AKF06980.1 hypothetical protein DB32_004129 [Sandaracinus amylolyticus]